MPVFFYPFMCALHFKNPGVKNLQIILECCVTVAWVVTFAVRVSHAPCASFSSAERLGRVVNLMKRITLACSASFMA